MERLQSLDTSQLWIDFATCNEEVEPHLRELAVRYIAENGKASAYLPESIALKRLVSVLDSTRGRHDARLGSVACRAVHSACVADASILQALLPLGLISSLVAILTQTDAIVNDSWTTLRSDVIRLLLLLSTRGAADELVYYGVTSMGMRLLGERTSPLYGYATSAARDLLTKLTHDRNLVAQITDLYEDMLTCCYQRQFPDVHSCLALPSSACFVVLYDTTQVDRDVDIANELVIAGEAWPATAAASDDEMSGQWADVVVTHVVDGITFWAHVGGDDATAALAQVMTTLERVVADKQTLEAPPRIGDAVCALSVEGARYRGRVVSVEGSKASVFAMDYGYCRSIEWRQLVALNGTTASTEPPVARLCQLQGVSAPPLSVTLIENLLALLCNLTTVSHSTTDVRDCNPSYVLHLCNVPQGSVCERAFRLCCNMMHSERLRSLHGPQLVKQILKVCRKYTEAVSDWENAVVVTEAALACLANLTHALAPNKSLWSSLQQENQALSILVRLREESESSQLRQLAHALLENQPRYDDGSSTNGTTGRERRSRSKSRCRSSSLGSSSCRTSGAQKQQANDRTCDIGILRSLSIGALKQSSPVRGEVKCVNAVTIQENTSHCCFIKGKNTGLKNDATHEIRTNTNIGHISADTVSQIVCSFLNSGHGGSVYFGLDDAGIVRGVCACRDKRDEFRMGIDRELHDRLSPSVWPAFYDMLMTPVHVMREGGASGESDSQIDGCSLLKDYFVIEIRISAVRGTVYTMNKACYLRVGGTTIQASMQLLRELVIKEEEKHYLDDISSLRFEIAQLRRLAGRLRGRVLRSTSSVSGNSESSSSEDR